MSNRLKLEGCALSPGIAVGTAFIYRDLLQELDDHRKRQETSRDADPETEDARVTDAIETAAHDLAVSAKRVREELDDEHAQILQAHKAMLGDESLLDELKHELERELVTAEDAVRTVFRRFERRFRALQDDVLNARADDVADLGRRLLRVLSGIHVSPIETAPEGSVLFARRLLPSDTIHLPRRAVRAVVLSAGGRGSHAAIFARAMRIPAVSQVADLFESAHGGDRVLVDGDAGVVVINPTRAEAEEVDDRRVRQQQASSAAHVRCRDAAITRDGCAIEVLANIGCREDAEAAAANGADGVGLYRTENLYLARAVPPSEAELLDQIQHTIAALTHGSITIRLLDTGGDKPIPYVNAPHEPNPFLGRRGVRFLLAHPEFAKLQIRVLLRVHRERSIRILVPMVTLSEELRLVRLIVTEVAQELGMREIPQLGAMIETPAAALCVSSIAAHADFLSIGTNDLTQYTMVAGRENPLVSEYFLEDHPAVLRLIGLSCTEAGDVPASLCGEMAGRTDVVPKLLAAGVRALSVAPPLVPSVKETVRQVTLLRS